MSEFLFCGHVLVMMSDDMTLVREFAARQSEPAFAALVERHIGLVHSAAFRQVGDAHLAEEITQAVFIVLARKAASLGAKTVLAAWLYRTTRYAAADALRTKLRRHIREQEAYMQSTLNEPENEAWTQLAPLLDDAMAELGETDRAALVLRYFENKSAREIAAALRMEESTAQKRVTRALEKLRVRFMKRGVTLTATVIAGAVAANSVQAAPVGLAVTVAATAAKGAAISSLTYTTVKGALKLMAWSKAQTAIVIGLGVLLAAGTATITIKEIQEHRTYPWQVQNVNSDVLRKVPPQVGIAPAKYPNTMGGGSVSEGETGAIKTLGIAQSLEDIVSSAYGQSDERTVFLAKVPSGKFDYIANLVSGNEEALRNEIKRKFGLVGKREMRDTDVLLLKIQNPNATGLKPANPRRLEPHSGSSGRSGAGYFTSKSQTLSSLGWFLEYHFKTPVIDQTGLTNRYDIDLNWDETDFQHPNLDGLKQALLNQLGLELVPTNMPIEMLIVEKVK